MKEKVITFYKKKGVAFIKLQALMKEKVITFYKKKVLTLALKKYSDPELK